MKNTGINFYTLLFCLFTWVASFAQTSTNGVRYQVTYDATTARYTVWVVPAYNTPNANNTGTTEKGATAQVTLAVPSSFTITSIVDVNGGWEKTPLKLGPGQPNQNWSNSGLPTDTNYYIIGKSATETDYGTFTSGTAVPLFTFQGVSCVGLVRVIPANDPFVSAADQTLSLNAGNSFYSRSGQPAGGNQVPLEQFIGVFGTSASCGGQLIATPVTTTITSGTNPTTISVLPNVTVNGSPATTSNVTITIPQQPTFGSVVVNPDGTIRFTPSPTFSGTGTFDIRYCLVSSPTNCVTSTITVQSPIVMTPITTPIVSGTNPTTIPVLPSITVGGQPATS
ncbi:MAG: Ig-like domain-containing protein, partial [Spirosomataceae bacterium]